MSLIFENYIVLLLTISSTITIIIFYSISYKKLKTTENNKLDLVLLEIEVEKKNRLSLKNVSTQINNLELKTNKSFQNVNVEIFNIDFSYKEVLANL